MNPSPARAPRWFTNFLLGSIFVFTIVIAAGLADALGNASVELSR